MKKVLIFILVCCSFLAALTSCKLNKNDYVSYNGALHVSGNKLLNEHDEVFKLNGAVLANNTKADFPYTLLENLKNKWKLNCIKLGMKPDLDRTYYDKMYQIIDDAISLDLYVVVIYWSGDVVTTQNRKEGADFFKEVVSKYNDIPNILYEVANEPSHDWEVIKDYANYIIDIIKPYTNNPIVLCPTKGHDSLKDAIESKLDYANTMYVCHVYIGSTVDTRWVSNAYYSNICVFISEWSNQNDFLEVDNEQTSRFAKLLERYSMSSTFFLIGVADREGSLCTFKKNKYDYTLDDDTLTETGRFLKDYLLGKIKVTYSADDYKMISNTNCDYKTYFWAEEYRSKIKNIYTTNNFAIPSNALRVYDLSYTSSGNIISYITLNQDLTYNMYIATSGSKIEIDNLHKKFSHFESLEYIDLSCFNSSASTISKMFDSCYKLKKIDGLSSIFNSKLENVSGAFSYCKSLEELDLRNADLSSVTEYKDIFYSLNSNCNIKVSSDKAKEIISTWSKSVNCQVV